MPEEKKSAKPDVTETCEQCNGEGVVQTPAAVVCNACDGAGVVPKGEQASAKAK